MSKIRFGLGGLFLLWVIGVAIWAAVALAQIARGDSVASESTRGMASQLHLRGPCRSDEVRYQIPPDPARLATVEVAGETSVCYEFDGLTLWVDFSEGEIPGGSASTPVPPPPAAVAEPGPTLFLSPPPNPLRGPLSVSLALASASPASLALFDVVGRRVVADEIGALGPGAHHVAIAKELSPGVYWLVLRQQGIEKKSRVVVLR
jgi:hypothetical protein